MKTNPQYKGKWAAPMVENPAYKGVWTPRQIANPDYYEDLQPADLHAIGGVGIELWTMTEDIMFDNLYVGSSAADAKELAATTFHVKHKIEQQLKDQVAEEAKVKADAEAELAKAKSEGGVQGVIAMLKDDPVGYVRSRLVDFYEDVQDEGPMVALQSNPQVGGFILASLLTLFGAIGALAGVIGSGSKPVVKVCNWCDSFSSRDD